MTLENWTIKTWNLSRSMTIPPLRRIYLSSRLSQFPGQKDCVLAHELEHAKRSEQLGVYLWTLAYIGGPAIAAIALGVAVAVGVGAIALAVGAWFPSMWFRVVEERHGEIAEAKAKVTLWGGACDACDACVSSVGYINRPWVYLVFLTKKQKAAEYKKIEAAVFSSKN